MPQPSQIVVEVFAVWGSLGVLAAACHRPAAARIAVRGLRLALLFVGLFVLVGAFRPPDRWDAGVRHLLPWLRVGASAPAFAAIFLVVIGWRPDTNRSQTAAVLLALAVAVLLVESVLREHAFLWFYPAAIATGVVVTLRYLRSRTCVPFARPVDAVS